MERLDNSAVKQGCTMRCAVACILKDVRDISAIIPAVSMMDSIRERQTVAAIVIEAIAYVASGVRYCRQHHFDCRLRFTLGI